LFNVVIVDARNHEPEICEIEHQEREKSIEKWQQQWDKTTKVLATKEFFFQ
jgi:hypothetical protein